MGKLLGHYEDIQAGPTAVIPINGVNDFREKLRTNPNKFGNRVFRLIASQECYIRQGDSTVVADTSDMRIQKFQPVTIICTGPDNGYLSAIGVDSNIIGNLWVTLLDADELTDASLKCVGGENMYFSQANNEEDNDAFEITGDATIDVSIKTSTSMTGVEFENFHILSRDGFYRFWSNSDGVSPKLNFFFVNQDEDEFTHTVDWNPAVNEWLHIAVTISFSGTVATTKIYANSTEGGGMVLLGTATHESCTSIFNTVGGADLLVNARNSTTNVGPGVTWYLKNLRLWSGALTIGQLNAIRTQVFPRGSTSGSNIIINWIFNGSLEDTEGYDLSVNYVSGGTVAFLSPVRYSFDIPDYLVEGNPPV